MTAHAFPLGSSDAWPDATLFVPFTCRWSDIGSDSACVWMAGELDRSTSPQLEATLQEVRSQTHLVLDLRRLEFMDCSGLRAIVKAHERFQRAGGQLTVVRGSRRVEWLFAWTGARDVLEIVDLNPGEPPVEALRKPRGDLRTA